MIVCERRFGVDIKWQIQIQMIFVGPGWATW